MQFTPRDAAAAGVVRELAQRRKQTQPLGEWSCGSVFTNPPGDQPARLIEAAGLKGARIGARWSRRETRQFHLNEGHATASDIEELINQVRETCSACTACCWCRKCAWSGRRPDAPAS